MLHGGCYIPSIDALHVKRLQEQANSLYKWVFTDVTLFFLDCSLRRARKSCDWCHLKRNFITLFMSLRKCWLLKKFWKIWRKCSIITFKIATFYFHATAFPVVELSTLWVHWRSGWKLEERAACTYRRLKAKRA